MPFEIRVPRLGWSMEEGIFRGWLKRDGEVVREGEPLFELEGDKALQEVEALESGTLRIPGHAPAPGTVVAVGALLGYLLRPGEAEPSAERGAAPASTVVARDSGTGTGTGTDDDRAARASLLRKESSRPVRISPRARRAAQELGIDPAELQGSGRSGRIVERDVRRAAEGVPPGGSLPLVTEDQDLVPFTPLRRAIAERMAAGVQDAAPVTLFTEVDATKLVELREELRRSDGGRSAGYNELLILLTARALSRHPQLNAWFVGRGLLLHRAVHLAIAVDSGEGLRAPVIREAERMGLPEICLESRRLIEQARAGRLSREEAEGATFTLTNLGMHAVDAFTPILHLPQVAVLGAGRIRRRPAVHEERVVPRWTIPLSLTFDHRALDGAPAARFLDELSASIADPPRR